MNLLGIVKGDIRYDYLSKLIPSIISSELSDFLDIDALLLPFGGIDDAYNIKQSSLNLIDILKENSIEVIFTGSANEKLKELCAMKGIELVEFLKLDSFVIPNAKITAIGIIDYLQTQQLAISDQRIILMGYGNISVMLAKLLNAYGTEFVVYTPDKLEEKFAKLEGYTTVSLEDCVGEYCIINTIPKNYVGDYTLFSNKRIIDVASEPFGFDVEALQALGVRYEIYRAIPSKFAPASAAKILKRMIEKRK